MVMVKLFSHRGKGVSHDAVTVELKRCGLTSKYKDSLADIFGGRPPPVGKLRMTSPFVFAIKKIAYSIYSKVISTSPQKVMEFYVTWLPRLKPRLNTLWSSAFYYFYFIKQNFVIEITK